MDRLSDKEAIGRVANPQRSFNSRLLLAGYLLLLSLVDFPIGVGPCGHPKRALAIALHAVSFTPPSVEVQAHTLGKAARARAELPVGSYALADAAVASRRRSLVGRGDRSESSTAAAGAAEFEEAAELTRAPKRRLPPVARPAEVGAA